MRKAAVAAATGRPSIKSRKRAQSRATPKSIATMILRLLARSASTPPSSERTIIGANESALTPPKSAAEPVARKRWSGRAKRRMALPKREMIWPRSTMMKSRWRSVFLGVCITFPPLLNRPSVCILAMESRSFRSGFRFSASPRSPARAIGRSPHRLPPSLRRARPDPARR